MSNVFYNVATDSETTVTPGDKLISPQDRSVTIRQGGVVSYSAGGEATAVDTYQSLNTADLGSSGGLQARTPWGSPRQGALEPTDIVQLPSGETSVQVAESLGLIERDVHGRYVLVPDGEARALANEQPKETPQEDLGEALSDAVEADFSNLVSGSSASTQFAILGQLVNDGEVNPNTIGRVSSELGIHPEETQARLGKVVESFKGQAVSAFRNAGVDDSDGFVEWCQHNRADAFKEAMQNHVIERTTQVYQPLVQEYLSTIADRDPEAVVGAQLGDGISVRQVGKTVLLNIQGYGEVDFKTAVREKFITVRGA
jgi:hypothetical protein